MQVFITLVFLAISSMVMSFRPSFPRRASFSTSLNYKVKVIDKANKNEWVVECAPDMYIIDAVLDVGIDAPYSCKAGSCNTCVGIVKSGTVDQADQSSLDEEQLGKGFALTCVAYPTSDCEVWINEQQNMFS